MRRTVLVAALWLSIGVLAASETQPWPTEDWPRSDPKQQGVDAKRIERLEATIRENREIRNIHSLLIVRNGRLILEEYFGGHDADELHELQSVSKSFTSALVGIAIAKGRVKGADQTVLSFFPDQENIQNLDDRKRRMTLEDLLTMRSGTDYHEQGSDSPHHQLNRKSSGWTEFILDRPMVSEPGTKFLYDSGAVILASAILHARYGVHADGFAAEHLFAPLGIRRYRWYKNAEGHPHTGGGLHLRSRDMARFGLLYLRDGRWNGEQVVPAEWVAASLSLHVEFEGSTGGPIGYGYWWWVLPPDPEGEGKQNIYGAFGFKGQYIFLVPELDMVVVVTAGARDRQEQQSPQKFLYSYILKAVR